MSKKVKDLVMNLAQAVREEELEGFSSLSLRKSTVALMELLTEPFQYFQRNDTVKKVELSSFVDELVFAGMSMKLHAVHVHAPVLKSVADTVVVMLYERAAGAEGFGFKIVFDNVRPDGAKIIDSGLPETFQKDEDLIETAGFNDYEDSFDTDEFQKSFTHWYEPDGHCATEETTDGAPFTPLVTGFDEPGLRTSLH